MRLAHQVRPQHYLTRVNGNAGFGAQYLLDGIAALNGLRGYELAGHLFGPKHLDRQLGARRYVHICSHNQIPFQLCVGLLLHLVHILPDGNQRRHPDDDSNN